MPNVLIICLPKKSLRDLNENSSSGQKWEEKKPCKRTNGQKWEHSQAKKWTKKIASLTRGHGGDLMDKS